VKTHTGGAHGAIHLIEELARAENTRWGQVCVDLLLGVKAGYPQLSWADLVAISGAAAVQRCGGPVIAVGLGRVDAADPAPAHRLPTSDEGAAQLRAHFERMGLSLRDLVALSGGHTLGAAAGRPFTADPLTFSNSYFRHLVADDGAAGTDLLPSDRALLDDPELRALVELYARDEARFLEDFRDAYRRLTWLGGAAPAAGAAPADRS
jgi:L-ascorbate peroxidase